MEQNIIDKLLPPPPSVNQINRCYNGRCDNLNGWESVTGVARISLETEKFDRPVIKNIIWANPSNGLAYQGITSTRNFSREIIESIEYRHGGRGSKYDITISYDIYSNVNLNVGYYDYLTNDQLFHTLVKPDVWTKICVTIPKGKTLDYLYFGRNNNNESKKDDTIYIKDVMITYGSEYIPYMHNPILPDNVVEQIVPGEFWIGVDDDIVRQVYIKTYKGTFKTGNGFMIDENIHQFILVEGSGATRLPEKYKFSPNSVHFDNNDTIVPNYIYTLYLATDQLWTTYSTNGSMPNGKYKFTIKYTKI